MSLIVGVVGFIDSGKGTVGDYLCKNYNFKHDSFAAPLKDLASAVFSWPRNLLEGDTKESRIFREMPDIWWEEQLDWTKTKFASSFPRFTPRVCLQLFGTEVLRASFNEDLWILSLQNRLRNTQSNIVVTDCRFPNEISMIKRQGGIVVRVKRGQEPDWYHHALAINTKSSKCEEEDIRHLSQIGIHKSEWAWIGQQFDYEIINDSSREVLYNNIDKIMGNYSSGHTRSS